MSVDASPLTSNAESNPGTPEPRAGGRIVLAALVVLALAAAVIIRFVATSPLWLDETLTVNIARLPLGDIPGALKQDGAPPLTYVLLHFWIGVFGTSTTAVRALSAVWGLVALPLAYLVGRRVGRSRGPYGSRVTAWATLLLVASSPFAARYATETRMYALQIVLVLLGFLVLTNLLDRPNLGWAAAVAGVAAALLYSHYWSPYLLAVVGAGLIVAALRAPKGERRGPLYGIGALVAGGVVFLPWVPTLLFQLAHTGTPWARPPAPTAGLAWTLVDFSGGDFWATWPIVLVLIVMLFLAVFGVPDTLRTVLIDVRTVPGIRTIAVTGFGAVLLALTVTWIQGGAVQVRYAALVFPLLVVATAFGLTVFRDPRIVAGVLIVVTTLGLIVSWHSVRAPRTQAGNVAAVINADAQPGDVVVFCPDQIGPDTNRLLKDGLVQRAFPDSTDPARINWVDYPQRMKSVAPRTYADEMLELAGPDHTVWLVWEEGYRFVTSKCEAILDQMRQSRTGIDRVMSRDRFGEPMGLVEFRP